MVEMRQISLVVPAISCEHCKQTIETALEKVAGVNEAIVDIANKRVFLKYDPEAVKLSDIESVLSDEGYDVTDSMA